MIEVVNTEILTLLDSRVIYPILDSKWVSLIHVVWCEPRDHATHNQDWDLISES
jgi:hypothetical protein